MKRIKSGITILVLLTTVALVLAEMVVAAPALRERDYSRADYVLDEIVVKFKRDTRPFRVLKVPTNKVQEKVAEYLKRADVEYAEPNYIAYALMEPNDDYYSYQWHLDNPQYGGIHMEDAWDVSSGSGVTVAIVDTGIAYENYRNGWWERYEQAPDLADTCFVQGYDFVNDDNHPNDDEGHGTHVAGTVAQSTNNNLGVAGIAFGACLMPVKVLNSSGSGSYSDVAAGIRFAADNGAKVINLSLGGSSSSNVLEEAVAYAYSKGVTVVAAAGNDGSGTMFYPAAYDDYVIAVGATRYDETLSYYSNYGPGLDLVAPGGDMNVDQNNDGYGDGVLQQTFKKKGWRSIDWGYYFMQGTSMATPHVAGTAALVISNRNASGPDEVRAALEGSAEDLGGPGWDETYGWGLVDAIGALNWTPGPVDNPPTVTITSPREGEMVSGSLPIRAEASDDVGVLQVDFYVDGELIESATSTTSSTSTYEVTWDSTSVADGSHVISAIAIDTASQSGSDSINVVVDNVNDPPVADAGPNQTLSDSDGDGYEAVSLDGSASYDPDGTIVSYEWREGATSLGNTAQVSYNFEVGVHTVTLTVTDDKNATSTDEVVITVNENQAPVANAGPDQTAYVGDTVSFDGSGSSDPDGSIVSYSWDFGDGTGDSGVIVSHSYPAAGTYTVTLKVTDNGGLASQDSALVEVSEKPSAPTAWVNIELSKRAVWRWRRVTAVVSLRDTDSSGEPLASAALKGDWSDAYTRSVSGTTDSQGEVEFRSGWIRQKGTVTFTVGEVTKDGQVYLLTGETSDSIEL